MGIGPLEVLGHYNNETKTITSLSLFDGGCIRMNSDSVEETIEYPSGTYIGEVSNGVPNGQGTFTYGSGSKYVGEHKDGRKHGQGTYTWSDGSKYVGEFKGDKTHGQGTYTYADGYKYVGEYKDDKRHGQGTFTFPSGEKYVGKFKDTEIWEGTEYDKDGNVTATYSEGVRKRKQTDLPN